MRDKNLNFIQFCEQFEKFVKRKTELPELLRTAVVDSTTFSEDFTIIYPKKFKEILGLILIHWYLPEKIKWEIHLTLMEMSFSHLNEKQKTEIGLLLHSNEVCLIYLYCTDRYSSHEIFGNLLRIGFRTLKFLRIYPKDRRIVRPKRKRGYDDKGSLRPKEKWLPVFDFTLTELQNEKEKKANLHERKINRLIKKLENDSIE